MIGILSVVAPVFLLIGAGYLAVWRGLFADSAVDGLMVFTQKFAIPCLLFSGVATLDLAAEFDLALLGAFYAGSTTNFFIGMFGARILFGRPWPDCVAIGFVPLFANSVLLGLPITERAYGPDALDANFAIIAVHAAWCYLLGITTMEIVKSGGLRGLATLKLVAGAMFRNALMIGVLLGFVVNLSGAPIPGVVQDALDLMIRAALPAALFGLGGILYRYKPEGDLWIVAFICALALLLQPAITYTLGTTVADLTQAQLRSAVVTAAMAPGINSYLFANMYGVARRVAATSVLVATALSVLTATLWIALLP
ncbi:AEC family transporter [Roseibacterium sp. SDUM158017]|uniref:AEC family transporter n=1 Tax=Roseicyclus salinarum TaxID=3036773 RepID=UPI0024158A6C|nr:AEC family transporter [Roseibacterium sp. SDUM158017]MDG4649344.1 AEC family transporter [Roseibacterium sp. SDUM158017]